jgi:hypothetical protein
MSVLERDPEAEDDLVGWWDFDDGLSPDTEVVVAADEVVVFWDKGPLLQLGPGTHALTTVEHPALAEYISFDEGPALRVAFVRTSNYFLSFDGPMGDVVDRETGLACTLLAGCESMELLVAEPVLVINEVLKHEEESQFVEFVSEQAVKATREVVAKTPPSARSIVLAEDGLELEASGIEKDLNERLTRLLGVTLKFAEPVLVFMDETDAGTVKTLLKL